MPERGAEQETGSAHLVLKVGDAELAFELARVLEISPHLAVTPVPGAPLALVGVARLRAQVIPIVDLAIRLGGCPIRAGARTAIVVADARVEGEPLTIGVRVDAVSGIIVLDLAAVSGGALAVAAPEPGLVAGFGRAGDRLVPVLDVDVVVAPERLRAQGAPAIAAAAAPTATPNTSAPGTVHPERIGASAKSNGPSPSPSPSPSSSPSPSPSPTAIAMPTPKPRPSAPPLTLTLSRGERGVRPAATANRNPTALATGTVHPERSGAAAKSKGAIGTPPPPLGLPHRPCPLPEGEGGEFPRPTSSARGRFVVALAGAAAIVAALVSANTRLPHAVFPLSPTLSRGEREETSRPRTRGGEWVEAPPSPPAPRAPPAPPAMAPRLLAIHEIRSGETLWALARRYYGDPHRWREIWRENRERLENPDIIVPKDRLRVPAR